MTGQEMLANKFNRLQLQIAHRFSLYTGCSNIWVGSLLFSLVQVQNQSFGPKQNTKFTVNHPPPPTENFLQGSRHTKRLKLNT